MTEGNGDSAWELSKENVQPVKSGRDVHCITAVLQPSKEDVDRLMREKQLFEENIIAGEDTKDPIQPWDSYLQWTIQNFPAGGNDLTLLNLLKKFVARFKTNQYIDDVRYLRAWLKLAEIMKDPLETFSFMNTEGIGRKCAEFYIAWADQYEKLGDMKRADRIYNDGDDKCAQPRELLQKRHSEFQLRFARRMLTNNIMQQPNNDDQQQRVAFAQLQGSGKREIVGTSRVGKAVQPLQDSNSGRDARPAVQQSVGFKIYEDDGGKGMVMGEVGNWTSAPGNHASKENIQQPGPWRGAKLKQQYAQPVHFRSVPAPPPCEFTVYEDDCQASEVPMTSRRIASNIESILSEKKETVLEFSDFNFSKVKSAIHEKPVHQPNFRSGYQVGNIYTVMGEMQLEEVRAAFWRKRQKTKAEQAMIEMQRKLTEEKKRLDEMRMKSMEGEMRKVQLEKRIEEEKESKMQQQLADLEARLVQVKILEKSAKSAEEERMLQKEEDDITIQLKSVKRKIRRASMKLEAENSCVSIPPSATEFDIYDENDAPRDNCPAVENEVSMLTAKQASFGNNSLNHSKRSQPSPTVNTKEAMSEIDAWFQKPLDDDAPSPSAPSQNDKGVHSFRPLHEADTTRVRQPARDENMNVFAVFTEEDDAQSRLPPKSPIQKKGLTARPVAPTDDYDVHTTAALKDDDKTKLCFDEDMVAGSHFTAKANLASTPFCTKSEKLQDMTQINQLSHIQAAEYTENLGIYSDRKHQPLENDAEATESATSDGYSHATNSMYHTAEKDNDAECPDEVKQLSPIMEASNESEKSSIGGVTKSLIRNEPKPEKSPTYTPPNFYSSPFNVKGLSTPNNGPINCELFGDGEEIEVKKIKRPSDIQVPCSIVSTAPQDDEEVKEGKRESTENCSNLVVSFAASPPTAPALSSSTTIPIIHNPWNIQLLNSIIERNGPIATNSQIEISYVTGEKLPKIRKGLKLELGGESFAFGQVIGEGAFAKVYNIVPEHGKKNSQVVKVQHPSCPWEVYAISHAKQRLLDIGMSNIADAIVNVNGAHFFDDGSLIIMPGLSRGTLLDVVNARKSVERIKDVVAMWIAYQIMEIVAGLHTVGIIHGDIKPDNFMVTQVNLSESTESLLQIAGIKLIDFGRAIDVAELPEGTAFTASSGTSAFMCTQMQNHQPWNYHIDFYGIAGTLHVVLFGSYMKIKQANDGRWETKDKVKRWYNGPVWKKFFESLLNVPTPKDDQSTTIADSPLPMLISEMKSSLEEYVDDIDCVDSFFRKF